MTFINLETWESAFATLGDRLFNQLQSDEHLSLELTGEQSQFTRLNNAKVRQTGLVTDGRVKLTLIRGTKTASASFPFTGDIVQDHNIGQQQLSELRAELPQLPDDPYIILPENLGSSHHAYHGPSACSRGRRRGHYANGPRTRLYRHLRRRTHGSSQL